MSHENTRFPGPTPRDRLLSLSAEMRGLLTTRIRQITKHPLFRLTLVGLAIRLVLAPITQFTYDPVVWYSAGNDMLAGLSPYYTKTYSYPPLWAYTYFPFLRLAAALADPRNFAFHLSQMDWISVQLGYYSSTILSPAFLFTIKLPLIIGDVATGLLLFNMIKGYSGFTAGRKAYIFWLFNPLVIWTSSVHGAFDVLPALFTVLSLMLLIRGKYLPSGMSLAIAILYKLYPLYLLPLYAILVWTDLGRDRQSLGVSRPGLTRLSTLALGGLIPVIIALPFVSIPDVLHAVFTRQAYLSSIGGVSPWMLNWIPGLGAISAFASSSLQIIQLTTMAVAFAISFAAGIWAVRKHTPSLQELLRAQIVTLTGIYLTLTAVNPQYLEWVLPFLTVSMYTAGFYKKRGMLVGALGFIFQLSLAGPLILLPITYLGLGTEWITAPVRLVLLSYGTAFNPSLIASGIAGGIVLFSFLGRRGRISPRGAVIRPPPSTDFNTTFSFKGVRRSLRATPTSLLAILIIAIALSAAIARVSITGQFLPTSIGSTLNGNTLTTQASFVVTTGNLPLQLNLLAAPITSLGADRPVFLYYDPRYPTLGNDPRGWIGILDHLPAELRLRGYTGQIQTVNASGLRVAMTQNFTSVIVIPSGVFPTTVQNATGGLVGNWLRSGGTLVWMGGTFGYYSAVTSEQTLDPLVTDMSPGVGSQTRILGYPLISVPINGTARIATTATSFSSALNLTYSDVWVAPTLGFLKSVGGLAIGHLQNSTDTSRSSVSLVPVGLGKLILFGGPVTSLMTADGEDVVSHDLAQILSLGDTISPAVVKYATFNLPANTSTSIRFTASFNVTSSKVGGLVIAAFSDYGFSRLYWRTQLGV